MPQFIHPLMLWGALAAAVPVVIHLIHRRRYRRQRWAAMEWLLEAVRQNQRRLQMENLLLLVVRTLAVLLLALAIARPTFSQLPLVLGGTQRTHLYVVLDNSASMAAAAGTRPAFDDAVAAVSNLVSSIGEDDPVTLVVTNDNLGEAGRRNGRARLVLRGQTDHGAVRRRLGELKAAPARADLADALRLVEEAVPATEALRRRVAIVTDLQESSFPRIGDKSAEDPLRQTLMRLREKGAEVVLRPVGSDSAQNAAITGLRSSDDRDIVQGSTAVFQAEIRNYSDRPQRVEVRFRVDGEQRGEEGAVQSQLLPARAAGPEPAPPWMPQYYTRFKPEDVGVHVVTAEIRADALRFDDTRALAFRVRPRIHVLVVDPDLHPADSRDDPQTYYLALSLAPKGDGPFDLRQVTEPEFHSLPSLEDFDLVILANVERPAPDAEARAKLEAFVDQGGALFLTVGDRVVAQRWNEELHRRGAKGRALLPAKLGEPLVDTSEQSPGFRFDLAGTRHPLFANLTAEEDRVLFTSPFLKGRFTLEGIEEEKESRVAMTYDDLAKSPAFVERRFGKGRVLLFTSSVDKKWSGLPSSYLFAPLLHEASYWLTTRGDAARNLWAFQPWIREVPASIAKLEVKRPDETTVPADLPGLAQSGVVTFADTDQLGVYTATLQFRPKDLLGGAPPVEADRFAVTLPPAESDIRRRPIEEMNARYRDLFRMGAASEAAAEEAKAREGEISTALIAAALACLLVEVWLVQRIGRRRRR